MTEAEVEQTVRQFEGLVKTTASQIVATGVELDFDDVRQFLRIKVWRAVVLFDAERAASSRYLSRPRDRHGRSPLQRFVFTCVANMRKDIEKRPRRFVLSVEELRDDQVRHGSTSPNDTQARADMFDARYLRVDREEVYAEADGDGDLPPQFETLTAIERQVVLLKMRGLLLCEIDRELGLSRAQRERVLESAREKLADLDPARAPRTAPMRPLPRVVPPARSSHEPLAA